MAKMAEVDSFIKRASQELDQANRILGKIFSKHLDEKEALMAEIQQLSAEVASLRDDLKKL